MSGVHKEELVVILKTLRLHHTLRGEYCLQIVLLSKPTVNGLLVFIAFKKQAHQINWLIVCCWEHYSGILLMKGVAG